MSNKTDHLDEDIIKLTGQTYALISVVSPQSNQKHTICGLKLRGVFATQEDAQHHAAKLIKMDTTFDIYVVEMYKWLPIPPNNEQIDEHIHQEDMLQEIVKGHKESQLAANHSEPGINELWLTMLAYIFSKEEDVTKAKRYIKLQADLDNPINKSWKKNYPNILNENLPFKKDFFQTLKLLGVDL